jgi:hypothetical protein
MKKGAHILGRSVSVAALAVAGVGLLPAAVQAGGLCHGRVFAGTAFAPVAAAPVAYAPVAAAPVAYAPVAAAPVAYAPVAAAPVAAAPVAYAPVAAAPVAYAPVATQALAPVAAAPTFTTGTTGYVVYPTGTAAAPAVAGGPQAAAAPTRSGYYRQKWEWVETPGAGAAGSPKARRAAGAAGAPRLSTLKRADAERVREAIRDRLEGAPSATLPQLVDEGRRALTTDIENRPIRDVSDLTDGEEADIRAIAEDEMKKATQGQPGEVPTGDTSTPNQPGTAVAQQVLVPTLMTTTAALAPVQLFVPTVHRCNIFCRH